MSQMAWIRLGVGLACFGPAAAIAALGVAVSVLPQKTFVERIGGERVAVQVMVGRGASPDTYDPAPRQLAALAGADVYFRIGVPFEQPWLPRLSRASPDMEVVDLRQGLELLAMDPHGHGPGESHGHGHGDSGDPHVWTSPRRVMRMADTILQSLVRMDPEGEEDYRENHRRFIAELEALDAELRERLAPVAGRAFLVFHPSWGYFAADYGLEQIAIQRQGKSPGPAALAGLVQRARQEDIRLVVVQREFSQADAQAMSEAIGAPLVLLDPLSPDYFATMRRAAAVMAESL